MADLRQGDVIKYSRVDGSSVYGVVVTADCDLAQKKFGNQVTFLPLVSVDEFIEEIWFDQIRKREEDKLIESIRRIDINLRAEDILEMLSRSDVDGVLRRFTKTYSSAPPKDVVEKYAHLVSDNSVCRRLILHFGSGEKAQKAIRNAILGGRAEFFFLPEQTKLPGMGSMVLLRYVSSFPGELVSPSYDQILALGRVEMLYRLPPNLKYAIAQSFAYLFSRIGIEDDIEKQQALSAELASERYAVGRD